MLCSTDGGWPETQCNSNCTQNAFHLRKEQGEQVTAENSCSEGLQRSNRWNPFFNAHELDTSSSHCMQRMLVHFFLTLYYEILCSKHLKPHCVLLTVGAFWCSMFYAKFSHVTIYTYNYLWKHFNQHIKKWAPYHFFTAPQPWRQKLYAHTHTHT